jgi:hypothetical protein
MPSLEPQEYVADHRADYRTETEGGLGRRQGGNASFASSEASGVVLRRVPHLIWRCVCQVGALIGSEEHDVAVGDLVAVGGAVRASRVRDVWSASYAGISAQDLGFVARSAV